MSCMQAYLLKIAISRFLHQQWNSLPYLDTGLSANCPNLGFCQMSCSNKRDRKSSRFDLQLSEIWCLLKTFPWSILLQKLCTARHAVIFEVVASIIIIQGFFFLGGGYSSLSLCWFPLIVKRTICYILRASPHPTTSTHTCFIFLTHTNIQSCSLNLFIASSVEYLKPFFLSLMITYKQMLKA